MTGNQYGRVTPRRSLTALLGAENVLLGDDRKNYARRPT